MSLRTWSTGVPRPSIQAIVARSCHNIVSALPCVNGLTYRSDISIKDDTFCRRRSYGDPKWWARGQFSALLTQLLWPFQKLRQQEPLRSLTHKKSKNEYNAGFKPPDDCVGLKLRTQQDDEFRVWKPPTKTLAWDQRHHRGALSVAWAQRPHQVASTFQNSISQV